jgi:hypothetical protein
MNRRLTSLTLTALALVALNSIVLTIPTPALAQGATQIAGTAAPPVAGACVDAAGQGNFSFALTMTGDLDGCLYVFIETADCSPSGTYRETGTETFVGQYNGQAGTFRTTFRYTAKYVECDNDIPGGGEIVGRCQHPIIAGSGTGAFAGVTGRLYLSGANYRGHLRWSSRLLSQQVVSAASTC